MVRGNWQRRVEQTEARKAVAKQRRQKKDNRASFKGMVSNLFTQMDQHRVSTGTIHVWTDTIPSDSPPILDLYEEEEDILQQKLKRGRSGSFQETRRDRSDSFNEIQMRGRSGSFIDTPRKPRKSLEGGSGSGKKIHPRSKESIEPVDEESCVSVHLCRAQFFTGKCDNFKLTCKKGVTCRHVHYAKHHKTLGEILSQGPKDVLENAENSLANSTLDDDVEQAGGMDMMYYFPIKLGEACGNPEGEQNPLSGQVLSRALSDKSCSNASLVYVAYENELIFDRYQTGVIVPELAFVFGADRRGRSASAISELSEASEEADDGVDAEYTPAAVLEYILTFLPDTAVASMARVCTSWHNEIGKSSSHLWRHMLERRNWPFPVNERNSDDSENFFKLHYQVVRDVQAVKAALSTLLNPRRGVLDEVEMAYQSFSTRRTAPSEPNSCVAIEVWAPSEVLVAYSHDCTIRLFKTVAKGPTGGRACRELISVCVNPYRKTTRKKARLVAMCLDVDTVGCLLQVQGGTKDENYILSIISRNDYLEAAGGDSSSLGWSELDDGVLNVISVGEAVVNCLLSADEMDHRLLRLTDFMNNGGEISDMEVLVSPSVIACGHGRFLIEVSISIPDFDAENDDDEDDDPSSLIMLDRKLVIFSSTLGAIVWMGDSNPTQNLIPRRHDLLLSGVKHSSNYGTGHSVVAVSSASPTILWTEIDTSGQPSAMRHIQAAEMARTDILSTPTNVAWELETGRLRPIALFPDEIVVVDVLFQERGDDSRDFRSIVSFYPRRLDGSDDHVLYHTEVFDNCNVLYMKRIRDEHVLLVCEELDRSHHASFHASSSTVDEVRNARDDNDDDDDDEVVRGARNICVNVLVLHVPTRHLIDRIRLPVDPRLLENLVVTFEGDTIGVGVWWKGIIMTGADVRAVGSSKYQSNDEEGSNSKNSSAKKKKRLAKKESTKGRAFRGKGMRS